MCGRYAQSRDTHELQLQFDFTQPSQDELRNPRAWPPMEEVAANHNIAPGSQVYAVLGQPANRAEDTDPRQRWLCTLRWGLVPSWAKEPNVGYKMINARGETVAEKPAYRRAFARRRCLIPADAYYEWQLVAMDADSAESGTSPVTDPSHTKRKARSRKRPFAVRYQDGSSLAFAGIFERWRDPTREEHDPAAWLWSCSIITTEASPALADIHERMPVVIPTKDWDTWLSPAAEQAQLQEVLTHTPTHELEIFEVGTAVNSVRNNGPQLLNPPEPVDPSDTLW